MQCIMFSFLLPALCFLINILKFVGLALMWCHALDYLDRGHQKLNLDNFLTHSNSDKITFTVTSLAVSSTKKCFSVTFMILSEQKHVAQPILFLRRSRRKLQIYGAWLHALQQHVFKQMFLRWDVERFLYEKYFAVFQTSPFCARKADLDFSFMQKKERWRIVKNFHAKLFRLLSNSCSSCTKLREQLRIFS